MPAVRVTALGFALLVAAALLLASAGRDGQPAAQTVPTPTPTPTATPVPTVTPAPFPAGEALREPEVVASRGGRLAVTLVARTGSVELSPGVTVDGMQTYSARRGSTATPRGLLGPTLRVRPGDLVELTLDQGLTVPPNADHTAAHCAEGRDDGHGSAGDPQLTNLHFHGLHVTPRKRSPFGDTVLVNLGQGRWKYRFRIPRGHDRGTFWYHAHRHGCTDDQVFRGLAGLLLIGDSRRNLPRRLRGIRTRSLALKDLQIEPAGPTGWRIPADHSAGNPTHLTVNGQIQPKLDIRPGETQLWRLANVSSLVWYKVALVDGGELDPLTVVGQDGTSMPRARSVTSIVIPPGRRFDVLVRGRPGDTRQLRTLQFDQGNTIFPDDLLATLEAAGPATSPIAAPTRLKRPAQRFPRRRAPTRRFTFDFDFQVASGFSAVIDDALFDPRIADATPRLGTTERWVIYNKTSEWHPFHIHQNDFRVISVEHNASSTEVPNFRGVQDIVSLPPGTHQTPSRVEIEMPFTDYAGQIVFHCHILDHEDAGMMSKVLIRPRGR